MRTINKTIRCFAMVLVVTVLLLSMTGAFAVSSEPTTVHAVLWQNPIYIEDVQAGFLNEQGRTIYPFSYQGTLYMPLRTAGEWTGCQVSWDQQTQTVSLTSGMKPYYVNLFSDEGQPGRTAEEREQLSLDLDNGIAIQINPNIQVLLDGEKQEFKNVKDEPVYPVVFRESVYLPVRSVGNLCGKEVLWVPFKDSLYHYALVFIYDTPSEQQVEEIQSYYASCKACYHEIESAIEGLVAANDLSNEDALEQLSSLNEKIRGLTNLTPTSVPFFEGYATNMQIRHTAWYLEDVVLFYIEVMSGNIAPRRGTDWNSQKENFWNVIDSRVQNGWGSIGFVYNLLDAAGIDVEAP